MYRIDRRRVYRYRKRKTRPIWSMSKRLASRQMKRARRRRVYGRFRRVKPKLMRVPGPRTLSLMPTPKKLMRWTHKYVARETLFWSYGNGHYDSSMREIPWLSQMFGISKNYLADTIYISCMIELFLFSKLLISKG